MANHNLDRIIQSLAERGQIQFGPKSVEAKNNELEIVYTAYKKGALLKLDIKRFKSALIEYLKKNLINQPTNTSSSLWNPIKNEEDFKEVVNKAKTFTHLLPHLQKTDIAISALELNLSEEDRRLNICADIAAHLKDDE